MKQVPIPDTNYVVELFLYDCAGQSIFNQLDMNAKYVSWILQCNHFTSILEVELALSLAMQRIFDLRTHFDLFSLPN